MHELAPLIYDLALILGLASLVAILFQRIQQPIVLGYLIAGLLVGPYTPPYSLINDIPNIHTLSELGVIFLMFSLGLEFSFQKLMRVGFSASITGLVEVILMMVIGYVIGLALGWKFFDSLFLGAALSISSTTIIIKAIAELGLKQKRFAEVIFGILIIEDLLAILLLAALSAMILTKGIMTLSMAIAIMKLILVVGGWFIIGYFFVPSIFRQIRNHINDEILTLCAVALCLLLVSIAAYFNYSPALGAFIMGSILAETDVVVRIEDLIHPIRDIFAAIFFISVGMLIDPKIIIEHWQMVLLISSITIIGKILTTSLGAFLTGQTPRTAIRVGFGMAQIGEFSFIIVGLGAALNVIGTELYPIVVAVSAITTFTTPYLIKSSYHATSQLHDHLPEKLKTILFNYKKIIKSSPKKYTREFTIAAFRLLLNAIVIAIIFSSIDYLIFSYFKFFSEHSTWANLFFLAISVGIASPFIWGMLHAFVPLKLAHYPRTRLNFFTLIIWLFTFTEVIALGLIYFRTWGTVIVLIFCSITFLIFAYKHLERAYHWLERQLVSNIKHEEKKKKK